MLCNLSCLKARLNYQWHSSLNIVSSYAAFFIWNGVFSVPTFIMICVSSRSSVPVLLLSRQFFPSVNILQLFYSDLSNYDLFLAVTGGLM